MKLIYEHHDTMQRCLEDQISIEGPPTELIEFLEKLDDGEVIKQKVCDALKEAKISISKELDKVLKG